MELSNTSQYAIRILTHIASQNGKYLISAIKISKTLDIPYKFLTKIMTELVKENLVESTRGRLGGFKLKKEASKIKIDDILVIFHDSISSKQCLLGIGICDLVEKCSLHDQWIKPKLLIQKMFKESTLEDIVNKGSKI